MKILEILNPLQTIAAELKIIRELYEADLMSRDKPIWRTTEKPRKDDTEVTYGGVKEKPPAYKRWFQSDEEEDDVDFS